MAITPAIATLRFCPPDNSNGDLSLIVSKSSPTSPMASRTLSFISSSSRPRFFGPKATSFATVSSKSWYSGYWKTSPTRLLTSTILQLPSVMHWPSTYMLPSHGLRSPFRCCKSVDLPEPVCPITPQISPSPIEKDTSSSARVSPGMPGEYMYLRFLTSIDICNPPKLPVS